ncbi:calcium-binding protein [Roseomonas sp. F4]
MTMPPKKLKPDELNEVNGGVYFGFVDNFGGTSGDDSIRGTSGRDMIFGHEGNDTLIGQGGDDALYGGAGADLMSGGSGDDMMDAGLSDGASDSLYGGEGNDRFFWEPGSGNDFFDGGDGRDTLWLMGVGLQNTLSGLQLDDPSVTINVSDGQISFTDQFGEPVGVSGSLTIGGEKITFASLNVLYAP